MQIIQDIAIDAFLKSPASEELRRAMETIATAQEHIFALTGSEDSTKFKLVKIATVFQIFLIDTLASGKKMEDLTDEDWKNIAVKVSQYAIMGSGEQYSEFVFTMYADYIDVSADSLSEKVSEKSVAAIKELAESIRHNSDQFREGELAEVDYIEGCLWLSLEAMMKLLSSYLTAGFAEEYSYFAQAASQLAFEYGRLALYSREQAIMASYIENQYQLDKELEEKWEKYTKELQMYSEKFHELIDAAFTENIHDALVNSAALARAAGVQEEEILETTEDIDDFFMG